MNYQPANDRYEKIPYRRCGQSGLKLPALSLGLWHNFGNITPFKNQQDILRKAFDLGITHFDLANNYGPSYGEAERNFGIHMDRDWHAHRDELVISTKAGFDMWPGSYGDHGSRKYLIASLDQSLKRMHLDYVDIFYHHRPDPDTPIEETMGALDQIVRSGILTNRYLKGIPADSRAANDPRYLKSSDITEKKLKVVHQLDAIAKERGQTVAQLALLWTLRNPVVTSALIGASRPEQVEENVRAFSGPSLSPDELELIEQILTDM